jgi:hypothetical protein
VVKKRATKKAAGKRKTSSAGGGGDRSRLDLRPLQKHIRRRISDLRKQQKKGPMAAAAPAAAVGPRGGSVDETIARLEGALETLIDICHPTMDIPI